MSKILESSGSIGLNDGVGPQIRFNQPSDLSVDEKNQFIYVSDNANCAIRRIFIQLNHKVETVVGFDGCGYLDGSFSVARLLSPLKILVDPDDSSKVYLCDYGNSVHLLDMKTKSISTFIRELQYPLSIAKNDNGLFFAINFDSSKFKRPLYVINGSGNIDLILDPNDNCDDLSVSAFFKESVNLLMGQFTFHQICAVLL